MYYSLNNIDIACLQETWLSVQDTNFSVPGYCTLSLNCRLAGAHGGVMILCKASLSAYGTNIALLPSHDFICAASFSFPTFNLCVASVYNPPSSSPYRVDHSSIHQALSTVLDSSRDLRVLPLVVMCGDFNLPGINWANHNTSDDYELSFLDTIADLCLQQTVTFSTTSLRVLDLVLTNDADLVQQIYSVPSFSDHMGIVAILPAFCRPHSNVNSFAIPTHAIPLISNSLSMFDTTSTDANSTLLALFDQVSLLIDALPRVTRKRHELPFFYSSHSIHMLNKLNTAKRRLACPERIAQLSIDAEDSIELDKAVLLSNCHTWDTREAFGFLNCLKSKPTYPSVMRYDGSTASDDSVKAEFFNAHFAKSFKARTVPIVVPPASDSPDFILSAVDFSPAVIHRYLNNLSSGNNAHMAIPLKFVRAFSGDLSFILCNVFKSLVSSCVFPSCWKISVVCPIHKKGSRADIVNYRPVAMLPSFSLIFEKIVFRSVYTRLCRKLTSCQYGFQRGKSTVSQLVCYLHYVYQALDEGETPAAIYFDIAKCFDSLDHQIIINKLANFGFDNDFLLLFSSYLANRTQCVKVNNYISSPTSVDSGGPQGSVFLIIFFLVYVNELPATSTCAPGHFFLLMTPSRSS